MSAKSLPIALLVLAAAALPAAAHDVVLVPRGDQLTMRHGHPHDWLPVDSRKVLSLQLHRADGRSEERHQALRRQGLDLALARTGGAWLAAASYDNGLWVRRRGGDGKLQWRNATPLTVPEAAETMAAIKFAKALGGGGGAAYGRRVGHLLELVPQKNPLALGRDEALPVLVLYDGQPLAGVGIEVSNLVDAIPEAAIRRYVTGSDGIAQVTLRPRGLQMLGVDVERPGDARLAQARLPADKLALIATYTFVRP